ncbi:MAG: dihydroorotase [Xanthomonadales bacterium]|nr:dihydroorotase [Gammaproteobacteria bacterium]NNL94646.1 dihydroorotase [Xanthomonadales bacterium]
MSETIIFKQASLVNEGKVYESDLMLKAGRIERIDASISAPDNAKIVDASGMFLLPGVIDDQVHFREPGLTHKGDIYTESRAAIAGGVTSFMDMPNTRPPTLNDAELMNKLSIAKRNAAANYAFYFGASNDNIEDIRNIDTTICCGVKVFMGSSTGNMLVDDDDTLAAIFRDAPLPIATHCESTPMIEANLRDALDRYGAEIPVTEHPRIRSEEACYASTLKAVTLARENDAQLHVLHLSTARELDLFETGPVGGKRITAETCIHFLHFTDADYEAYGNRIKCNPSVKTAQDRDALLAALESGRLDIIATDHAPHTLEEKALTDYRKAPSGLPLVQDTLLAALELVEDGKMSLKTLVRTMCHNPARRFQVRERGFLREGYHADLVLVDPAATTEVTAKRVLSKCAWSPFEGRTFRHRIVSTWLNGVLAFDGDKVIEHGAAQALEFDRLVP